MRKTHLPFALPTIGEEDIDEVVDVLRSGWITTGARTATFERDFASFLGAPTALAVSSCTAALHLGLVVGGVREGDAVVTTPMTFCSTVHAIEQAGARPVLGDVDPETLTLDPLRVEQAVRQSGPVAAVVPVHLYGHPVDVDSLEEIAAARDFTIVDDAAHALPASFKGRRIGSGSSRVPTLTAFSFYATKSMTTGEGGMLTGPTELVDRARILSLHGMSRDSWNRYGEGGAWRYEVVERGFKYNMSDLQAALGIHQLRRLPALHERRRAIVRRYQQAFTAVPDALERPVERVGVEHAWHIYALQLRPEWFSWYEPRDPSIVRDRFIEELARRKIGTSVHFIPIHLHPYYRDRYGWKPGDFPNAFHAYERLVSLPLFPAMSDGDADDVIGAVMDVIEAYRR